MSYYIGEQLIKNNMKKILLYIILFLTDIDGAWALPIEKEWEEYLQSVPKARSLLRHYLTGRL